MSVVLIAHIRVNDRMLYERYVKEAKPIIRRFGGNYLVNSENIVSSTMTYNPEKVIVIEFPDRKAYDSCFSSDEYKKIVEYRLSSTESQSLVVEN